MRDSDLIKNTLNDLKKDNKLIFNGFNELIRAIEQKTRKKVYLYPFIDLIKDMGFICDIRPTVLKFNKRVLTGRKDFLEIVNILILKNETKYNSIKELAETLNVNLSTLSKLQNREWLINKGFEFNYNKSRKFMDDKKLQLLLKKLIKNKETNYSSVAEFSRKIKKRVATVAEHKTAFENMGFSFNKPRNTNKEDWYGQIKNKEILKALKKLIKEGKTIYESFSQLDRTIQSRTNLSNLALRHYKKPLKEMGFEFKPRGYKKINKTFYKQTEVRK